MPTFDVNPHSVPYTDDSMRSSTFLGPSVHSRISPGKRHTWQLPAKINGLVHFWLEYRHAVRCDGDISHPYSRTLRSVSDGEQNKMAHLVGAYEFLPTMPQLRHVGPAGAQQ